MVCVGERSITEDGPQDVDASAREGEQCLRLDILINGHHPISLDATTSHDETTAPDGQPRQAQTITNHPNVHSTRAATCNFEALSAILSRSSGVSVPG